jgi:hypothetical protein
MQRGPLDGRNITSLRGGSSGLIELVRLVGREVLDLGLVVCVVDDEAFLLWTLERVGLSGCPKSCPWDESMKSSY